jgi:hypothetical protein
VATEFAFQDEIMVLDGRVLELFHSGTEQSIRYHVTFLRQRLRRLGTPSPILRGKSANLPGFGTTF